ncbi:MAG: hypothetical protein D6717_09790 [Gammaproteobacteria bacterium]|nr:MAG: hypothetical protein D6717_09790 [Gammaproteobacteria bacterium]
MSERLPERVDPWRLVQQRRVLQGESPLERMSRLAEHAGAQQGAARVLLEFLRDDEGHPRIRGQIEAEVGLVCQRCMEPFLLPLRQPVDLILVSDDVHAEQVQAWGEPVIVPEQLFLRDLIEDELLLGLPLVPRHEDEAECHRHVGRWLESEPERSEDEQRSNPFAVLGELKSRLNTKD